MNVDELALEHCVHFERPSANAVISHSCLAAANSQADDDDDNDEEDEEDEEDNDDDENGEVEDDDDDDADENADKNADDDENGDSNESQGNQHTRTEIQTNRKLLLHAEQQNTVKERVCGQ